jgi:hypothetical protein
MRDVLQRLLQGRYVRLLESEIARERAENERLRSENCALTRQDFRPSSIPKPRHRSLWRACASAPGISFKPGKKEAGREETAT